MDQLGAIGTVVEVGAISWMCHKSKNSLLAVGEVLWGWHPIAGHQMSWCAGLCQARSFIAHHIRITGSCIG